MDVVGQVSPQLSTAGQLRLMQWVGSYQQTLRGLGVQEVRRFVGNRHLTRGRGRTLSDWWAPRCKRFCHTTACCSADPLGAGTERSFVQCFLR